MEKPASQQLDLVIGKDIAWKSIKRKLCRVIEFVPFSSLNGDPRSVSSGMPYAKLVLECEKPLGKATIWITNMKDFTHLWKAIKMRANGANEEVLVVYEPPRSLFWKVLAVFLPRLHVMIFEKGTFDKITDIRWLQEGSPEKLARVKPIADWRCW